MGIYIIYDADAVYLVNLKKESKFESLYKQIVDTSF